MSALLDLLATWYSRAWCAVDGHQWVPTTGGRVCIRTACRGRTFEASR